MEALLRHFPLKRPSISLHGDIHLLHASEALQSCSLPSAQWEPHVISAIGNRPLRA